MWRDIKGYEGLYEINENAVVRRVDGTGIDGRKVSTHVVVSSRTKKGTRYIALWKEGGRRTYMLHKLYATAFQMSEKGDTEAVPWFYRKRRSNPQCMRDAS